MSCKSLMYTVNSTTTTVAANGIIPVGNVTRRFGQAIRLNRNSLLLLSNGYYLVSVNLTAAPAAAGTMTVTLNQNGVAVAGGTATMSAVADSTVQFTLSQIPVRVMCDGFKTLTVTLSAEADVNVSSITVQKV